MGKVQVKRCSPSHPLDTGELGWCKEKEVLLVGRGDGTNKEIGEGRGNITEIIVLDQADYDALTEKNATTLYLIRG